MCALCLRDLGSVPRHGRIKYATPPRSENPRRKGTACSQFSDPEGGGEGSSARPRGARIPALEELRESPAGSPKPRRAELSANGLDLWYKPFIRLFLCWSCLGALGRALFGPAKLFPSWSQPGVLVLADQPDAPGQRITAAAGHPGLHQSVE